MKITKVFSGPLCLPAMTPVCQWYWLLTVDDQRVSIGCQWSWLLTVDDQRVSIGCSDEAELWGERHC